MEDQPRDRSHRFTGRLTMTLLVLVLVALNLTNFFELVNRTISPVDFGATLVVSVLVAAATVFLARFYRSFDPSSINPPLGWSPTISEEAARAYVGFQMQADEHGQLVPARLERATEGRTTTAEQRRAEAQASARDRRQARQPAPDASPAQAGRGGQHEADQAGRQQIPADAPAQATVAAAPTSSGASTPGTTDKPATHPTGRASPPASKPRRARGKKRKVRAAPQAGKAVDTEVEVGPALSRDGRLPTPQEIYDALGEYVIGQEEARRTLAVAVYNHYKRTAPGGDHRAHPSDVEIAKSNIMLLGPTGSGKTLMVQTLARILDVPLAIADATTLTDAGYVGDDVESMLGRLIAAAGSPEAASLGIIYVDEIDKIARGGGQQGSFSLNGDPSGEGVQQAMLKLLEGTQAKVPPLGGRTNLFQRDTQIDTTNILFICGGAFVGLTDIVRRRTTNRGIGFASTSAAAGELSDDELLSMVEPEDLHRFGLIPEFVGRIPIVTHTRELDAADMVRILTEPRNALIRQYQELFAYDGVELAFDDEALEAIGARAIERGTGARGLRSICERVLRDAMFEVPGRADIERVVVHARCVTDGEPPEYVLR